ncbi:MAG: polyprenyl synthetase family protein [Alphaproteobacteria bacterium]|nr:polyprenyl synthetase family protein [Alphaproteobacteria bacterium]
MKETLKPTNPLETLSDILHDDMAATNKLILDRLQSDVPLIPKVASYLIAAGGKRIRPLLTLACGNVFKADKHKMYGLAASVEFIHSASLLHDDVVDESDERRGQPAANLVFGNHASVLVGDFLFARAFELMVETGKLRVLALLSEAARTITEGEVLQLVAKGRIDLSYETYLQIIAAKTSALFGAACASGPALAGADEETVKAFYDYGYALGMGFQLRDDVLDYTGNEEKRGKVPGDDFREGKITGPVILALEKGIEADFWQRVMIDKQQGKKDFARALDILGSNGLLEESEARAAKYADQAVQALAQTPNSPIKQTLCEIAHYAVNREA